MPLPQTLMNLPTAPLWRRLAALVYDSLIILGCYLMLGLGLVAVLRLALGDFPGRLPNSIQLSLLFCVCFFYYSHSWRRGGQTIGMKAWHIRLVNLTDKQVSLSQCMLRVGTGFFSLVIAGVGFWWAWLDKQQRSWHDMASLTRVAFVPKDMQLDD